MSIETQLFLYKNTLLITTRMRMFISCALLSKYAIVGDSQLQNGNQIYRCHGTDITPRADYRFAPSQWEMSLQSNAVCHWLGANLESALTLKQSRFITHFFLCTRLISIRGCKSSIPVPYHLHRATVLTARMTNYISSCGMKLLIRFNITSVAPCGMW